MMATTTPVRPQRQPAALRTPHLLPIRPETAPVSNARCRVARSLAVGLLRRMTRGQLALVEGGVVARFGSAAEGPTARIRVLDQRAWLALVSEGSIGLGRGYLEGWWDSDDPVEVVRLAIANMEPLQGWQRKKAGLACFLPGARRFARAGQPSRDREDIEAHYDIGTDFFSLFLDETLTYSSGVFESPGATLHEAAVAKFDRLLDKLDVGPGDRVLEIGTGWGGLALHAASTRDCHVTTTTVSADQYREASLRVEAAGFGESIECLYEDWRNLSGRYDKIISIEMIEAVSWRDYERFFATIERLLTPGGMAGIQTICVPDRRFEAAKGTEDFIKRFVFPGGGLPSVGAILNSVSGSTTMDLLDVEDLSAHYAETLQRWRQRFDQSQAQIRALGFDERFSRLWRFYLAYCEAAFTERHCTVNQIVIVRSQWRPDGLALRPR